MTSPTPIPESSFESVEVRRVLQIALAVSAAVNVVLAAVLLFGGGSSDEGDAAAASPTPTTADEPVSIPAEEASPLDVAWLPTSCVDSETVDTIEVQLLPFRGEDADRFCDFTAASGVDVQVQHFANSADLDGAYQEWLDAYGLTRDTEGQCPEQELIDTEGPFLHDGVEVGRILCMRTTGTIVWYQYGLPYLARVYSSSLRTAFEWWQDHPFDTTTPWS